MSAGWVLEATGVDHAERFRNRYKTAHGARRAILREQHLALIATRALGDPMPASLAQRGDVVLNCSELGETLGICIGDRVAFPRKPAGLGFVKLSECVQAWRV